MQDQGIGIGHNDPPAAEVAATAARLARLPDRYAPVLESNGARSFITFMLSFALFMTALVLVFGGPLVAFYRARVEALDVRHTAISTVLVGVALGVLVSISSVGAGMARSNTRS